MRKFNVQTGGALDVEQAKRGIPYTDTCTKRSNLDEPRTGGNTDVDNAYKNC